MVRNVVICLLVALAFGFIVSPQGRLLRCSRPTTGLSRMEKALWRDTCVLAYHPSEARLLPKPAMWRGGVWPAVVSRALAPWLVAGLVAGLTSASVGQGVACAALGVLVNFVLFLIFSVRGGLVLEADLWTDLRKILSDPALAGSAGTNYLRLQDLLGFGCGLGLAILGAALGGLRFGRDSLGQRESEPIDALARDEGGDMGASGGFPLRGWLGIGWRLASRDFRGAAVRLEDAGQTALALRLYRKAGREDEAARLCEEKGMVFTAAHLFEKIGHPEAGAAVLERAVYLRRAAAQYEKAGRFDDAGRCLIRAGDLKAAADVYRRGGLYDKAAQIYLESGDFLVAARCYAKVGEYAVAARIAEEQGAFREASEYYERMRDWDSAAQCLRKAGDPEAADRMASRKLRESMGQPTRIEAGGPRRQGGGGKPGDGSTN